MRVAYYLLPLAATLLPLCGAIELNVNDTDSIKDASATIAYGLSSWYQNNQSSTATTAIGTFNSPLYWWEAGAVWGGLIDYWAYTNDTSYVPTVQQALMAQVGPDNNYMPPAYYSSLGNDDQAFWAIAVLSAVEYGFPIPEGKSQSVYLDLAEAVFNTQWPRWDTTSCNGGLKWQIFQSNAGYDYKNSISNGGLFQISARLARYTGNQTYLDWAEKTWDWMSAIGLISPSYDVFDGTDDTINCSRIDHTLWSYNPSMLLYGSAMLYNYTNGSQLWENRTTGLLEECACTFFTPFPNSTDIMYEPACELDQTCNYDQLSFKAYLARWLSKSAVVAPYIASSVNALLTRSAQAAAQSCSGGQYGNTCGQKWYVDGYDGSYGVGQELSALETVQSLLLLRPDGGNATRRYPFTSSDVQIQVAVNNPTSTLSLPPKTAATAESTSSATKASSAVEANTVRRSCMTSVYIWTTIAVLAIMTSMISAGALVE
ncbi:i-AAA protease yme1 [Recurvomyces mirabilis]|nr:i-AAA protease yme1 [Recurvomyces mirabilis]